MFWQAKQFALYMFSLRLDPFLLYTWLSCLSEGAIQSTLPSPKFFFQKCGSGCCWLQSQTSCGAYSPASITHMVSTLAHQAPCRWIAQPVSMAWRCRNWTAGRRKSDSQRRKPERGTRSTVALAMAVAVRLCAAEAQPWNQTSGNTNKLSWNLFLRPPDRLLYLPPWKNFLMWLKCPQYPNAVTIIFLCCNQFVFLPSAFSFPNKLSISYANLKNKHSALLMITSCLLPSKFTGSVLQMVNLIIKPSPHRKQGSTSSLFFNYRHIC